MADAPDVVSQNQPDFSRRYRPIDAARYNSEQAQAYYERMRARANRESKSLIQQAPVRSTPLESAYQTLTSGRFDPQGAEYRTENRRQQAHAQSVTETAMQMPGDFLGPTAPLVAEFTAGEAIENSMSAYFRRQGYSSLGAMARGVAGSTAIMGGAMVAAEGINRYTGLGDAMNQFSEVRNLQNVSAPMTAGVASGPGGRMDQDMAQQIVTDLSEQGRLSPIMSGGDSKSTLKKQAGILSDFNLLEGVRSAEEFERKFSRLREGVQKVVEVMGTTFKEGAKMMKDFRNMGADPMEGVQMLNQGRLRAAQFGTDFREMHAAGMKSAAAMRGTGFSMGAGYAMGQYAQGMAQTIDENGFLTSRQMYNMGGRQGLRMQLQRGQMKTMESAPMTAMMMGAFNPDNRSFDMGRMMQTLRGNRSVTQNANAASNNINSLQDILRYRATSRGAMSEMMETNPALMQGINIQSVINQADEAGLNPEQMSQGALSQFAASATSMTAQEFQAQLASVQAYQSTLGRRERERRRTSEARARDVYETGLINQFIEGARQAPMARNFIRFGAETETYLRNKTYNVRNEIANSLSETFQGRSILRQNGAVNAFFQDVETSGTRGTYFEDRNDLLASSDASDILDTQIQTGAIQGSFTGDVTPGVLKGTVRGSPDASPTKQEALNNEIRISEEAAQGRDISSGLYSAEELRNRGFVMGETNEVDNIGEALGAAAFQPGYQTAQQILEGGTGPTGRVLQYAANFVTGGGEQTNIIKKSSLEDQVESNKKIAGALKSAVQSAPEDRNQMSTAARKRLGQYQRALADIPEEQIEMALNQRGEEGGAHARQLVMGALTDQLGIELGPDEEVNDQNVKDRVARRLQNDPAARQAAGVALQGFLSGEKSPMLRDIQKATDYASMSASQAREQREAFREDVQDTADDALADENVENYFDSKKNADKVAVLAQAKTMGVNLEDLVSGTNIEDVEGAGALTDRQKEKLVSIRTSLTQDQRFRPATQIVNNLDPQEITSGSIAFARSAKEYETAGEGQQSTSAAGVGVTYGQTEEGRRAMIEDGLRRVFQIVGGLQTVQERLVDETAIGTPAFDSYGGGENGK